MDLQETPTSTDTLLTARCPAAALIVLARVGQPRLRKVGYFTPFLKGRRGVSLLVLLHVLTSLPVEYGYYRNSKFTLGA